MAHNRDLDETRPATTCPNCHGRVKRQVLVIPNHQTDFPVHKEGALVCDEGCGWVPR